MSKRSNQSQDDFQSATQDDSTQRVAELTEDLQRLQAEFINYKTRTEAEKTALSSYSKGEVVKELLPVIDDLERALKHLPDELKDNKWDQGVQKAYERLQKQLEKLGITKIEALNQEFNHDLHEAIEVEGEGDTQIVSEVLQNGYQYGDQVIRHAVVKVRQQ